MKAFFPFAAMAILTACTPPQPPSGVINEADLQASCEALVAAESGIRASGISARPTQFEATGSITLVDVQGVSAPWLCLADVTGVVTGVEPGA